MATREKLEVLLWRGEHFEVQRDGEVTYAGSSLAAVLAVVSSFFQVLITTEGRGRRAKLSAGKPASSFHIREVKERATAKPEKLEILFWRGEHIEIRRDGKVVCEGRSFAAVLDALSSFFQTSITTIRQMRKRAKAAEKRGLFGVVRGFFGRCYETRAPFTPPPPPLLPEQRLTSVRERALLKVARGIPLSSVEEDTLIFGEQLLQQPKR